MKTLRSATFLMLALLTTTSLVYAGGGRGNRGNMNHGRNHASHHGGHSNGHGGSHSNHGSCSNDNDDDDGGTVFDGCECNGKMQSFTVVYNGASGATVDAFYKIQRNRWSIFQTDTNLQDGDTITFLGFDRHGRLGPQTVLAIGGDSYNVHTSCSENIMGNVYGPFTVIAYTDGNGAVCNMVPPPPPPSGCVYDYYLSRNISGQGSEIYAVTLNGANADLDLITTFPNPAHLAFDEANSELYIIFNTNPLTIQSYNVATGTYGPMVTFSGINSVIQGTFMGGDLYIGSASSNTVYIADYTTGTATAVASLSIEGGDMSFTPTGELWSASNSTNTITQVGLNGGTNTTVAPLAATTVGLALMPNGEYLLSEQYSTELKVLDASGNWTGATYDLMLNGATFEQANGDLAVGCNPILPPVDPCASFNYYLSQNNLNFPGDGQLYGVTLNGTDAEMTLIADLGHRSHIAMDRLNGIIYILNNKQPNAAVYTYDINTGTFSPEVTLNGLTETVQAVYHDGTLYVGTTQGDGFVAEVDPVTGTWSILFGAPVEGGDLVVDTAGNISMATRVGNELITYNSTYDPVAFTSIPSLPTGIALALDGSFILSKNGSSELTQLNDDGSATGTTYTLKLNGSTYTAADGDLTSGCGDYVIPSMKTGSTTSTEDAVAEVSSLKLFPNPAQGKVNVALNVENTDVVTIEVYNTTGQMVHTINSMGSVSETIDISNFHTGLYLVNVMVNGERTNIEKLMVK